VFSGLIFFRESWTKVSFRRVPFPISRRGSQRFRVSQPRALLFLRPPTILFLYYGRFPSLRFLPLFDLSEAVLGLNFLTFCHPRFSPEIHCAVHSPYSFLSRPYLSARIPGFGRECFETPPSAFRPSMEFWPAIRF